MTIAMIALAACSSSGNPGEQTRTPGERKAGPQLADGTYVGPRGDTETNGVPKDVGAFGKRKKHKGDLTIKKDGTDISDIDVEGVIYVNANNVAISNFTAQRVTQKPGFTGMELDDGTINGHNKGNDGIQWSDFTLRRMDISHTFDGIKAHGNVTIEDSYVHDLHAFRSDEAGAGGYSHNDCIQVSAGKNVLIQRNWLDNCGFNSAIFVDPDQAPIDNVTIQNNYLNSGGITLYVIASRSANNGIPQHVTVSNNVFGSSHQFAFVTLGAGVTFTKNVTTDGKDVPVQQDGDTT
jgi:hypothetical protein